MNEMNKILIVGLGNPGKQYKKTPHNAGFEVIDELVRKLDHFEVPYKTKNEKYAVIHEALNPEGMQVIFAKPLLYMNRSGEAAKQLLANYNIQPATSLWIVHDDIDLPLGTIRVKKGGQAAGHKGLADIIEQLGQDDFYRFRVGVRPQNMPEKRSADLMSNYVTKKPGRKERKILKESITICGSLVEKAIDNGIESILGDHNVPL